MKSLSKKLFISIVIFMLSSCELRDISLTDIFQENEPVKIEVAIAKWYDNHTAALCIDNDAGSVASPPEQLVQQIVKENNLTIDYEFVTERYRTDTVRFNYLFSDFLPMGFGYFGHGDTHINHDLLSEEESYESFKKCYDTMIEFGLKPVSYAYPGGFGHLLRTQRALKRAGFLSARRFEKLDVFNPYIMPDDKTEPENWYELPSLVMQAYDYISCSICINNTQDLIPHLDKTLEKRAWLIITYHSIGQKDSYGFYYLNDFKKDLLEIKKRDFWVAHNDDVTLYVIEKNEANVDVQHILNDDIAKEKIKIIIDDRLDNEKFDVPLTLLFDLPDNWLRKKLKLAQDTVIIGEYEFEKNPVKISLLPNEKEYELRIE
jgi:hypothetical protein